MDKQQWLEQQQPQSKLIQLKPIQKIIQELGEIISSKQIVDFIDLKNAVFSQRVSERVDESVLEGAFRKSLSNYD